MKMKATILWAAAFAAVAMASCSKSEDVSSASNPQVSEVAVKAAFGAQFPTATNVSWSGVDGFQVASFTLNSATKATTGDSHKCTAWYSGKGKWEMTEIEYTSDQLPAAVKTAFVASEYGSWTIVKLVSLKKADGTEHFKFELSKTGENNVFLYFDAKGTLLKVKEKNKNYPDCKDYPNVLPDTLKAIVLKLYPAGVTNEVMQGPWGYWVQVKDGATAHDLYFSRKYVLLMDISELTFEGLPKPIQDAVKASDYATWTVLGIRAVAMKDIPGVYVLIVKNGTKHMMLMYTADGKAFQGANSFGC
jgi:hypothetical protein